jgi:hypothetical protein
MSDRYPAALVTFSFSRRQIYSLRKVLYRTSRVFFATL